jgi:hypothetical protein
LISFKNNLSAVAFCIFVVVVTVLNRVGVEVGALGDGFEEGCCFGFGRGGCFC